MATTKAKTDDTEQAAIRAAADFFGYLHERWQDEREYEDFAQYREAMAKRMPPGAVILKMTSRPFRMEFQIGDVRRRMLIRGGSIVWMRLS